MARNFVSRRQWIDWPKFDEYKEWFKEYFILTRKDGILECRMHYDNGPVVYSYQMHNAITYLWSIIGHDKENEVIIFTGTGDEWIATYDHGAFAEFDDTTTDNKYNVEIFDTMKIVEDLINDIEVPIIVAFNGSGVHWEMGMFSDLTIAVPEFVMRDDHVALGAVAGDGMFLAMQELLGLKRANAFTYFNQELTAQELLDYGLINEIVPREKLLDRAWEMAYELMKVPRNTRRLTHSLAFRPWRRALTNDFREHVLSEMYKKNAENSPESFQDNKEYAKK